MPNPMTDPIIPVDAPDSTGTLQAALGAASATNEDRAPEPPRRAQKPTRRRKDGR